MIFIIAVKQEEDCDDEMLRGVRNYKESEEPDITGRIPVNYNEYTLERQEKEGIKNKNRNRRIYEKSINNFENGGGLLPPDLVKKEQEYLSVFDKNVDIANQYLSSQENEFFNTEQFMPFDSSETKFMDLDRDLKMGSKNISLTGKKMEMIHNNMVPFFKSNIKQNVNDNIYQTTKLETFTGTGGDTYINKKEQKNRFKPEPNRTHIFGAPNTIETQMKYVQPSMYRNNERPIEPVRVAPGLNKGFTDESTDGFHPKYRLLPKSTDDLRTANKPKKTYKSVTIPGKNVTQKRSAVPLVHKNRPEKFRELTSDDWFKTQGEHVAHRQYPTIDLQDTNRQTTGDHEYKGIGQAQGIGKSTPNYLKARTKESFKNTTVLERPGIIGANDSFRKQGYSENKYIMPETERKTTGTRTHQLALKTPTVGKWVKDKDDIARITRKSGVVDRAQNKGGIAAGSSFRKPYVHDPDDIARITRKEGVVDRSQNKGGIAAGSSFRKPYVHDPDDIARITRKEGIVDQEQNKGGIAAGSSFRKPYVHDPDDIARITRKEGIVDQEQNKGGIAAGSSFRKPYVHDPDDIARITRKEGVVDQQQNKGVIGAGSSFRKPYVHDPDDIARITRKEGVVDQKQNQGVVGAGESFSKPYVRDLDDIAKITRKDGVVDSAQNTGVIGAGESFRKPYVKDPSDIAKITRKQQTTESDKSKYTGAPVLQGQSGSYSTTNFESKDTLRQITSSDYTGIGGMASGADKQSNREKYNNAESSDSREKAVKGRAPTSSGPKLMSGSDTLNFGNNKKNINITDDVRMNVGISHRNVPIYVKQQQQNNDKTFKQNRVDLSILDSLKVNPFHLRVLNMKNPY